MHTVRVSNSNKVSEGETSPSPYTCITLCIVGASGSGKTHGINVKAFGTNQDAYNIPPACDHTILWHELWKYDWTAISLEHLPPITSLNAKTIQ